MNQSEIRMGWFGSLIDPSQIHSKVSGTVVRDGKVVVPKERVTEAEKSLPKAPAGKRKGLPGLTIVASEPKPIPIPPVAPLPVENPYGPWILCNPKGLLVPEPTCPIPKIKAFQYQIRRRGQTQAYAEKSVSIMDAADRFWGFNEDASKDIVAYRVLKNIPKEKPPRQFFLEGKWENHDQSAECPIPTVRPGEFILQYVGDTHSDLVNAEVCWAPVSKVDWTKVAGYKLVVR